MVPFGYPADQIGDQVRAQLGRLEDRGCHLAGHPDPQFTRAYWLDGSGLPRDRVIEPEHASQPRPVRGQGSCRRRVTAASMRSSVAVSATLM